MKKRYIRILNKPLDYNGEKCTAYEVENNVYLDLDPDKVKGEFGELSICFTIQGSNNQIKFVNSGDIRNVDKLYKMIEKECGI